VTAAPGRIHHLRAAGVGVVLDARGPGVPSLLHWGADLGHLDDAALEALATTAIPPVTPNTVDVPVPVSLVPEHSRGWFGAPGLTGHRDGSDWSPVFELASVEAASAPDEDGQVLLFRLRDQAAWLGLTLAVGLGAAGLLRLRGTLHNEDPTRAYGLESLAVALPMPGHAVELLDLTGRHTHERVPQRQPFHVGTRLREGRRGRTGTDASLVLVAGEPGFGFRRGEVWGLHVGWSGNHRTYAERLPSGAAVLGGGELLLPGEVVLGPGESYSTPWLYASYGSGLDEMSARFHRTLRARPDHPTRRGARPVVLNTWEAVYFDHDLRRLTALADAAAEVGVERFVLDDGWFRGRRDDTAGLGDWDVDPDRWPRGLGPLVDHVRRLGMQFGLWVEPEMVSPDSDLARAHPDWVLSTGGRLPPESRHQQVLDLAHPAAYGHVLGCLDALIVEYEIDVLKWDHNRDLVDAGRGGDGRPAVHAQTLAVYALLDELRRRHPRLEIESCSSGGGRVDLGILARTDRVWASDCNDALERQAVHRWTGLLLPPELVGTHVGPPRSHTTSRRHDLTFRAGTALFGHFGVEWDLTAATEEERVALARWVAGYVRLRDLLHTGTVVRTDHPDPALWVHGVVAEDRSEAVFAVVAVGRGVCAPPGRVRLPGLDDGRPYQVSLLPPGDTPVGSEIIPAPWLAAQPVHVPGGVLGRVGLQVPDLHPEQLVLLHVQALPSVP
jgi:alpha-galactosidase